MIRDCDCGGNLICYHSKIGMLTTHSQISWEGEIDELLDQVISDKDPIYGVSNKVFRANVKSFLRSKIEEARKLNDEERLAIRDRAYKTAYDDAREIYYREGVEAVKEKLRYMKPCDCTTHQRCNYHLEQAQNKMPRATKI